MQKAIGMIELSSIAQGFLVQDEMLKAAMVDLLIGRTICSGKYIVVISGEVGAVKASIETGVTISEGFIIDSLVIPNIDEQVLMAISGCVDLENENNNSLGIIETFSASSIIEAADYCVKAADVKLLRVHVSMAVGGKGFLVVCSDVGSVKAAIDAGVNYVKEKGMLVNFVVIPSASKELFKEYI
jgi:microcompartment protein CcmL/EutN